MMLPRNPLGQLSLSRLFFVIDHVPYLAFIRIYFHYSGIPQSNEPRARELRVANASSDRRPK